MKSMSADFDKELEYLYGQVECMNKQFVFYIDETSRLEKEAERIHGDGENITPNGLVKLDDIEKRIEELFKRYSSDRKFYFDLIEKINKYFKAKYNLDLNLQP